MIQPVRLDPIVRVSRDLTEILNLSKALTAQAIQKAKDKLMPGGRAMVALGPVASPTLHAQWLDEAEETAIAEALRSGLDPRKVEVIETDDDDWEPPLQTLRYWSERWRQAHNSEPPTFVTLESEANYIRWTLPWASDNEPQFDTFAENVNAARRRLENVLYAGDRADRTRVTCDRDFCAKKPQLIRVHAQRETAAWACIVCTTVVPLDYQGHRCPNPWCGTVAPPRPIWHSDTANDRWKCTSCKTRYDDDDYKRAHAKQLRSEGAEKYVLLSEAIATLKSQGRPPASVRSWLKVPEHVADQCTICRRKYDPEEHGACPRHLKDPKTRQDLYDDETGEPVTCGGDLDRIWKPELDSITAGYCELATRRRMVWWPDLWTRHRNKQTRKTA